LHEFERLIAHVEASVEAEAFIFALVAGPMPWNLPTGRASTNAGPISGVMTYWPFGLRWSEANFARNLL
jgi:hypothetical protein